MKIICIVLLIMSLLSSGGTAKKEQVRAKAQGIGTPAYHEPACGIGEPAYHEPAGSIGEAASHEVD